MQVKFFVPGEPVAQGSKRGFFNRKTNRVILVESSKNLKPWRSVVSSMAHEAMAGVPTTGRVSVHVVFRFPRPKSHYKTGKNSNQLRHDAPLFKSSKPDLDKLLRSLFDSCSSVVFKDDCQVVSVAGSKIYHDQPGAEVVIGWEEEGK